MNQISQLKSSLVDTTSALLLETERTQAEVESVLLNDSLSNESVENDQEMVVNEELFQYIHWIQEEQIKMGRRIGEGG